MIRGFRGKFAEAILRERRVPKGFPTDVAATARRKLVMLNNAGALDDLLSPPGNRLEALKGNLAGKHSGSTINGESSSDGPPKGQPMSKSSITIEAGHRE